MKYIQTFESFIERQENYFNYNSIIDKEWNKLIKKAQDFQKINFDLENNDSTGQRYTLLVSKNLRKDQPIKYEFNLELCEAGGDWENLVMYFRIEFTHSYFYKDKESDPEFVWDLPSDYSTMTNKYVIIPGPDINHLAKSKAGYTAHTDDSIRELGIKDSDTKITEEDHQKAWTWIEDLLTKLVEDRHKMLDESILENTSKHKGKQVYPKLIYHKSIPTLRDKIEKNGLIPQKGDSYNTYSPEDYEIPAIFGYLDNINNYDSTYDDDIWQIDTKGLDVEWFEDKETSLSKGVMTYEKIPRKFIKLIYKGTGKDA